MSLLLTTQFARDAQTVAGVLQKSPTASAVLSALGVSETGLMSPFAVRVDGGKAELDNLWGRKWATASNEVLVYEQLKALLDAAQGFEFPNLGPKALVTYDGMNIVSPAHPTGPAVHRLEVDLSKSCHLAWKLRPNASAGLDNSITEPLRIAIGVFSTPVQDTDYEFADCEEFFTWLMDYVVYEPITLVFAPGTLHEFVWPPRTEGGYEGDSSGLDGQHAAKPYNFRSMFRGRGRFIITSATDGVVNTTQNLAFRFFSTKGVNLEFRNPTYLHRDTNYSPAYALDVQRCNVNISNQILLFQNLHYAPDQGQSHDVGYGMRWRRCTIVGTGAAHIGVDTSIVPGIIGDLEVDDAARDGWCWGEFDFCVIRNVSYGGYSSHTHTGSPLEEWRRRAPRLGFRFNFCRLRYTTALWADTHLGSDHHTSVNGVFTMTFVNSRVWARDVQIGHEFAKLPTVVNLVNTFWRCRSLTFKEMRVAPSLLKLANSSMFMNAMSIDCLAAGTPGLGVDRSLMQFPGFIWLQHSQFGVLENSAVPGLIRQLNAAVKPAVYVEGYSRIHMPSDMPFNSANIVFDPTADYSNIIYN